MNALELFLSKFHRDELWAECLKCGRRYESEDHRCDREEHTEAGTNSGACREHRVTQHTEGRMADG